MKKWLMLTLLFLTLQVNAHAMNLDSYIVDTGKYASQIDGIYFSENQLDQFIGGPAGQDLNANAFQFTISQPITINHLSIDATVLGSGDASIENLPITFQIYDASSFEVQGTFNYNEPVPDLNSLVSNSKSTSLHNNGTDDKVYDDKRVSLDNTTLQPGTYWLTDEITPPSNGGASVDLKSVDFEGRAVAPELPTVALFGLGLVLLLWKRLSLIRNSRRI